MTKTTVLFDADRKIVAYRISGHSAESVAEAVDKLIADLDPSWGMFTKPIRWGDEYVTHGELSILNPLRANKLGNDAVAAALGL